MAKTDNTAITIIGIVALVVILFFFVSSSNLDNDGATDTNTTIFQKIYSAVPTIHQTSISNLMHSAIDPVFPTFLPTAESNCIVLGGTWVDTASQMGCYDIPTGAFDSRRCITEPVYVQIGNTCNGLDANWVCDINTIGCEY